jgi:hypothetical protein
MTWKWAIQVVLVVPVLVGLMIMMSAFFLIGFAGMACMGIAGGLSGLVKGLLIRLNER